MEPPAQLTARRLNWRWHSLAKTLHRHPVLLLLGGTMVLTVTLQIKLSELQTQINSNIEVVLGLGVNI